MECEHTCNILCQLKRNESLYIHSPEKLYTKHFSFKNHQGEAYLVVRWLILQAPNAGGLGWIPGQGTTTTKSLHATAEDSTHPQ